MNERIRENLCAVYGDVIAAEIMEALVPRIDAFRAEHPRMADEDDGSLFSERDVALITYGDQIQERGVAPLRTLHEVLAERIGDVVNTVHILPFFPYTSDDGFAVVDYVAVDPALGDWGDVQRMSEDFRLMFDAVINHMSRASEWFQAFVRGEVPYNGYFISVDPSRDLSDVVRPRTSPLLTPFEAVDGVQYIWTTFSADQVDLNYAEPRLLLEITDVLLWYVSMGARLIRLDAIAFLWKEIGTSCLHLPQTHHVVRFLRGVLDEVAPDVLLITETNVLHVENLSYLGDGENEAQMVYNFTLPPLTLHAFQSGDATRLSAWARTLETPSDRTAFFNFLASHDGVGLRPVEGILSADEVGEMAARVEAHGGYVSYRSNRDGTQSPYELNVVYYDALNDPAADEAQEVQVARFLCSQAILLSLAGVPGIYVHSLFGSRNWRDGVDETGRYRTINRRKFRRDELEGELGDAESVAHQVFAGYRRLIACRVREPAFHPSAAQAVVDLHPALFALRRTARDGLSSVLCLHNVSGETVQVEVDGEREGIEARAAMAELISGRVMRADEDGRLLLHVEPTGVLWLKQG